MNNFFSTGVELDKYSIIPARIDDLKKFYRALKGSLLESLSTFNHFGKALSKSSRQLHFSFNHADPSFISKLTLTLLTRQTQTSHLLSQSIGEAVKELSKEMETYEEKLEQMRLQTSEIISESLKLVTLARANYAKEKTNYEKACKEAEGHITERKKPITDPLLYYNLTHHRRLKRKVLEALQALKTAEQQTKDALELYSIRQQGLNIRLSESMRLFKAALHTMFENSLKNIKKYNLVILEFLKKELEDFKKENALSSIEGFTFAAEIEEQQFIDHRKQHINGELPQSSEQNAKETATPKEAKEGKRKFLDLHQKILQKPQGVSDGEMYEYPDLTQKHFEAALLVFEERQKVVKNLKTYIQELNTLCLAIEKVFQKLSKTPLSQNSSSILCKKLGVVVDPLFEAFGSIGAVFQQLGIFVNSKVPVLDGVINDQKENLKAFQSGFNKVMKDCMAAKVGVASIGLQCEKLYRKIIEMNEKDPNDDRLPGMKVELESLKKQREEQIQELRKQAAEAAKGVSKVFEDYSTQEHLKFTDFHLIIKGILIQEHLFSKSLLDVLSNTDGILDSKGNAETEIKQALNHDDMNGYLNYYELNMLENPAGQKVKESSLIFNRLYIPPEDAVPEDEGENLGDIPDDDETQTAKEQEKEDPDNLRKRFGRKTAEKELDNFACGVEQTIIRQGRMYVYSNAICFTTVKLLGNIAVSIPIEDIIKIEKKTMSLVFDTALSVITKNGEIKFLSFFSRDKAFTLILSLLKDSHARPIPLEKISSADSTPKYENQNLETIKKKNIEQAVLQRVNRSLQDLELEKEKEEHELRRNSLVLTEGSQNEEDADKQLEEEKVTEITSNSNENREGNATKSSSQNDKKKRLSSSLKLDELPSFESKEGENGTQLVTVPSKLNPSLKKEGKSNEDNENKSETGSSLIAGSLSTTINTSIEKTQNIEKEHHHKKTSERQSKSRKGSSNQTKNDAAAQNQKNDNRGLNNENNIDKNKKEVNTITSKKNDKDIEEQAERQKISEILDQRKLKLRKNILPDDQIPNLITQEIFSCSAADLYASVFSERKVVYKDKTYDNFWMLAKVEANDTEIKYTKWTPQTAYEGLVEDKTSLEYLKKIADRASHSTRQFTYTHPVKDGGPFVPKTCQVEEKHNGYWLSPDEFFMQMEVITSKIPLSDTFIVKNSFQVKELSDKKCEFTWRLGVDFVKSTMFKSKIMKTSIEENNLYGSKVFMPLLRNNLTSYLKEKAQLVQKREEAARQSKEKKEENNKNKGQDLTVSKEEAVKKDTSIVEEEKKSNDGQSGDAAEIKENEDYKSSVDSTKEQDSDKNKQESTDSLASKINLEEEFVKFVKSSEQSRHEMRNEIKGLRNLITIMIGLNCFVLLFLFFKS